MIKSLTTYQTAQIRLTAIRSNMIKTVRSQVNFDKLERLIFDSTQSINNICVVVGSLVQWLEHGPREKLYREQLIVDKQSIRTTSSLDSTPLQYRGNTPNSRANPSQFYLFRNSKINLSRNRLIVFFSLKIVRSKFNSVQVEGWPN